MITGTGYHRGDTPPPLLYGTLLRRKNKERERKIQELFLIEGSPNANTRADIFEALVRKREKRRGGRGGKK